MAVPPTEDDHITRLIDVLHQHVEITYAEYIAQKEAGTLPPEAVYFCTDAPDGSGDGDCKIVEITYEDYIALDAWDPDTLYCVTDAPDSGGGPVTGTTVHEELTGRDEEDQHPMSAITGLNTAISGLDGRLATAEDAISDLDMDIDDLEGAFDLKANKVQLPHIDFDPTAFNVPAGRTLVFNDTTTPTLTGGGTPQSAIFAQVNGNPNLMFGFYTNDDGATTIAALFKINDAATGFEPIITLYDGTTWLNGGEYVLRYGITGDFQFNIGAPALNDFDLETDITVKDEDLIDLDQVYYEQQLKQYKLTPGANISISDDRYNPVIQVTGLDGEPVATNNALGIVKGAFDDGKVRVELDGTMSINLDDAPIAFADWRLDPNPQTKDGWPSFQYAWKRIIKKVRDTTLMVNGKLTDTAITPNGTYPGSNAFVGGVLLPDGSVFCVPYNSTTARIYDPETDTTITPNGTYPGSEAFAGGVLLPDGRVFCVPLSSTTARIYDPETDTTITPNGTYPGSNAFFGGVLLPDGRVFCAPFSSTTARIITTNIYAPGMNFSTSPYFNKF
jgi:hypothetical protein